MKRPTEQQIMDACIDAAAGWRVDQPLVDVVTNAVGRLMPAEKPAEPETVGRTGQWLRLASSPSTWYGPATHMDEDGDHCGADLYMGAGIGWCISERDIAKGEYLRIPPPPADAPADLKGWVCREPETGEPWLTNAGTVCADEWFPPHEHPDFGKRRWIPPKAARKPWPVGPFKFDESPDGWMLVDRNGNELQSREHFEASAFALGMLPKCWAWLQRHHNTFIAVARADQVPYAERDALLAEFDQWDMPTGEPQE